MNRLSKIVSLSLLASAPLIVFAAAGSAATAAPAASANPQQERMKTCNAEAGSKSLKGDARSAFMKNCLSGKPADERANTPQQRMKDCNVQAGEKKLSGDARKSFMSSCLKTHT